MTDYYEMPSFNSGKIAGLAQFVLLCCVAISGFLVIMHPFSWPVDAYYLLLGLCLACLVGVVTVQCLLKGHFLDIRGVRAGWDIGEQWVSPVRLSRSIRRLHRKTFPAPLKLRGSVSRNLTSARAQGRGQAHRSGTSTQKKKAPSDSGDGDSDRDTIQNAPNVPPTLPEHSLPASVALFLSFRDLARRWSCAEKTLRNQVCVGKLPRPVHLPVGPRWPLALIEAVEQGRWSPLSPTSAAESPVTIPLRRGRPCIASSRRSS
jgi:hypothetical protein